MVTEVNQFTFSSRLPAYGLLFPQNKKEVIFQPNFFSYDWSENGIIIQINIMASDLNTCNFENRNSRWVTQGIYEVSTL